MVRRVSRRTQTADGSYYLENVVEKGADGVSRASIKIYNADGDVLAQVSDKYSAEEWLSLETESSASGIADKWSKELGNRKAAYDYLRKTFDNGKDDPVMAEAIALLKPDAEAYEYYASKYKDGLDLLEKIANRGMKGPAKSIAEFLMAQGNVQKLKDVKIAIDPMRTYYSTRTNTIYLRPATLAPEVELHEVVHALTVKGILANDKGIRDDIVSLMEYTLENTEQLTPEQKAKLRSIRTSQEFKAIDEDFWDGHSDVAYGLLNEYEFLSQAINSESFRNHLQSIKGQKKKNILNAFIDKIIEFFGWTGESTVFKEVLFYMQEATWAKEGSSKAVETEALEIDTDTIVRDIMAGKGPAKDRWKSTIRERMSDIKNFAETIARPISDIVQSMSPKIYSQMMRMESRLMSKQAEYSKKVKPFMEWYNKLSDSEKATIDIALMNGIKGKSEVNKEIINSIPKDVWKGVREVLDDLNKRSTEVGLSLPPNAEYYFPRRVKDVQGLIDHLQRNEADKGLFGAAIREEANRLGIPVSAVTEEMKTQIVHDMFQAGYIKAIPRPGATKERKIPLVQADTYQFYSGSGDAIMGHIFEMNEKIGQREFIGGSTRKKDIARLEKEYRDIQKMKDGKEKDRAIELYDLKAQKLENLEEELKEHLASKVYTEMSGANSADQRKMINLINARLQQRGAHGVIDHVRNVNYAATMGNFLSAITQLGDIPITFYAHGLNKDSLTAVGTAFKNVFKLAKAEITGKGGKTDAVVEDIDFTNTLREFSQASWTSSMVERLFKYSGLKYTDLIGKEAFMQATLKKYQRSANKDAFYERFEPMFGKDIGKVYSDIQLGKKSDDVTAVLIAELSDWQPVTLSQQSEKYLTGGNARIFYMLKTFTLRSTSAALREGTREMNKGNYAKGAAKVAMIIMIYSLAGASTDELKNLIRGKEEAVSDNVIDNVLQMFFLSKYTVEKGVQSDSIAKTILTNLMPPIRYVDNFGADVYSLMSDEKEFKFKSLGTIPMVGSIMYSRSDAGQDTYNSIEKEDILKAVRENKKDKKGAYAGGLSKRIREYNKGVSRDDKITSDTIMRSYKN
jgi:hypothetical protein